MPDALPEADALAVLGAESMVLLRPHDDPDDPPPRWEPLGLTRCGVHRGWRWIAFAEDLAEPMLRGPVGAEAVHATRVRVYDRDGACVWDSADAPPPVARVDPPRRKPTAIPPGLARLLLDHHDRWDDVRRLLKGDDDHG